ncbi:hypothetical protein F5B20DRAFT_183956 [Whalleya microplaca]|nr:hypothetical protein F5B20DRAFT_183956 [Whalleya microplaca]
MRSSSLLLALATGAAVDASWLGWSAGTESTTANSRDLSNPQSLPARLSARLPATNINRPDSSPSLPRSRHPKRDRDDRDSDDDDDDDQEDARKKAQEAQDKAASNFDHSPGGVIAGGIIGGLLALLLLLSIWYFIRIRPRRKRAAREAAAAAALAPPKDLDDDLESQHQANDYQHLRQDPPVPYPAFAHLPRGFQNRTINFRTPCPSVQPSSSSSPSGGAYTPSVRTEDHLSSRGRSTPGLTYAPSVLSSSDAASVMGAGHVANGRPPAYEAAVVPDFKGPVPETQTQYGSGPAQAIPVRYQMPQQQMGQTPAPPEYPLTTFPQAIARDPSGEPMYRY